MRPTATGRPPQESHRVIVVAGGTSGMGRALTLARAERGDQVVVIGSDSGRGKQLLADASANSVSDRIRFLQADLSTIGDTRRVIEKIKEDHDHLDALLLFANRPTPKRRSTSEGLEYSFALYYLSRYLLSHGLRPALDKGGSSVAVNIAGVGITKGSIHWDDLQLERKYTMVAAQLQAGRANDLLGVAFAEQPIGNTRYVLYHPGFTRSGDLGPLPAVLRASIRAAARLFAQTIDESITPIHGFIDNPPLEPLTAIDRGRPVPLTLETLDPANARRLTHATEGLLSAFDQISPDPNAEVAPPAS